MDTSKMGIVVSGLIAAKNTFVSKASGEQRFSVDITVPGNRQNISVGVTKDIWERVKEFEPWQAKVSLAIINGNYIFSTR